MPRAVPSPGEQPLASGHPSRQARGTSRVVRGVGGHRNVGQRLRRSAVAGADGASRMDGARRRRPSGRHGVDAAGRRHTGRRHRRLDPRARAQRHRRAERAMGAPKLRDLSDAELLEKFRTTTAERRMALSDMSNHDWNQVTATPAGPDTYGRFMRVRVFDCWMHELDVRDAVGQQAGVSELVGPAAEQALDEMATSMGFVVGKLGGAPDGVAGIIRADGTGGTHDQRRGGRSCAGGGRLRRRRPHDDDPAGCPGVHPAGRRPRPTSTTTPSPTAATRRSATDRRAPQLRDLAGTI